MMPRLLMPWLQITRNRFTVGGKARRRTLLLSLIGLGVCVIIYFGSYRVLSYFRAQDELGILLSLKILQMIWILLFTMLIFSSMVTAVATLYLSQDNEILLAAPLPAAEIFQMRYLTTSISTSWMVLIFSLPVFWAYGEVFQADIAFWPLLLFCLPATALSATAFAIGLIIAVIYLFPAKRTKDIILYLSLCFGLFLYLIFRLIQPENLVNPDKYGEFIEYFSAISGPAGPWLPAGWAADLTSKYLLDRDIDWLLFGLLATTPMVLYWLGGFLMGKLFFTGFSKSQESFGGHRRFRKPGRAGSALLWIMRKELKQFTRDSSQWSQFFMIGALVVVYLYNFKALPLERSPLPTIFISNIIAFANIGLAGFMSASLATRFVYPAIGAEKGAFYLIQGAPFSLGRYLWYKYLFYWFPFTLFTTLLITASNSLLNITGPMSWISLFASLVITWTVLGVGLGFGALFADFKSENSAAAMGPGAIFFLFCSVLYSLLVLGLGVFPTYHVVRRTARHLPVRDTDAVLLAGWAVGVAAISLFLALYLCRRGVRRLQR